MVHYPAGRVVMSLTCILLLPLPSGPAVCRPLQPPIRHWSNAKGEGKLFSVDLLDESGALRATGFNEAVDRLYDTLEVGKVYVIRGGRLKTANKRFTQIQNDYELSMDESTTFVLDSSDASGLPQQNVRPLLQPSPVATKEYFCSPLWLSTRHDDCFGDTPL